MKKISLYWKCQLIGWLLFASVSFVWVVLNQPLTIWLSNVFILIKLIGGGIIVSHSMKIAIKKFRILAKSFPIQILTFLALTIIFTIAYVFILNLGIKFYADSFNWVLTVFFFQSVFLGGGLLIWNLIYFMYHYVQKARNEERQKVQKEKELLELEAKALRARMNPHFIFNCLNSIKALIQSSDQQKAIDYLTTFSKLIRTLFYNSDKRRITLFDELENCRLYMELEAMRLNGKLSFNLSIDPDIDTKSVMVPALIIQPFIENAIWHGIVPRGEGQIDLRIHGNKDSIICEIDDNGIGRELSMSNKPAMSAIYESKGIDLSKQRLQLEKTLKESDATIETIDKYLNEAPSGTIVKVSFKLN